MLKTLTKQTEMKWMHGVSKIKERFEGRKDGGYFL